MSTQITMNVSPADTKAARIAKLPNIRTSTINALRAKRSPAYQRRSVSLGDSSPSSNGSSNTTPATTPARGTPVLVHQGVPYDSFAIRAMGDELAAARRTGEMPSTRAPTYIPEVIIHDHALLLRLRELRGDPNVYPRPEQYNTFFVEVARIIHERDIDYNEEVHDANVHKRVENMVRDQNVQADTYAILDHAIRNALANANSKAGQTVVGGVDMVEVLGEFRGAIQQMAKRDSTASDNSIDLEAIFEDVYELVEASLLDAAGPLRLNVNRFGGQLGDMNNAVGNLNTQVGAMNNHVGAVGNHVNALGALAHSINNTVNATSGQMGTMTTQLNTLRQVVEMLPELIPTLVNQAIAQALPGALQAIVLPMLLSSLSGAPINGNNTQAGSDAASVTTLVAEEKPAPGTKTKKRSIVARVFRFFKH